MKAKKFVPCLCLIGSLCLVEVMSARAQEGGKDSVVPPERQVTEDEVTLAKARILSEKTDTAPQSVTLYVELIRRNPRDLIMKAELGDVFLKLKRFNEAGRLYQEILSQEPQNSQAALQLGKCLLWTDRNREATRQLQVATTLNATDAEPWMYLARGLTRIKEHAAAIKAAVRFAELKGKASFDGLTELGDAQFGASSFTKAIPLYEAALRLPPKEIPSERVFQVRKNLALALSWSDRTDEAVVLFEDLITQAPRDPAVSVELARSYSKKSDFAKVDELAEKFAQAVPADSKLLWDLGDVLLSIGHFRKARDLFLPRVNEQPLDPAISAEFADRELSWGAFDDAIERYNEYLRSYPGSYEVLQKLGRTLVNADRFQEADTIYQRILQLRENDSETLIDYARLKLLEGDTASAKILGEKASATHTVFVGKVSLLKGEIAFAMHEYKEALSFFEAAAEDAAEKATAQTKKAVVLAQMGESDKVETLVRSLTQKTEGSPNDSAQPLAPQTPSMLGREADLSIQLGQPETALRLCDEALEHDTYFVPAQMLRAELLGVLDRFDESVKAYDALLEIFPTSTKMRVGKARTLAFAGRYDEALQVFEEAHALFPQNSSILREAARTALWGKQFDRAASFYNRILTPSAKEELQKQLDALGHNALAHEIRQTLSGCSEPRTFKCYEDALAEFEAKAQPRPKGSAEVSSVAEAFQSTRSLYLLQKGVTLEFESKAAIHEKHPAVAHQRLEEVLAFEPGNREALFDLAQVKCTQGDLEGSRSCYHRLLELAPLHKVAPAGLDRLRSLESPKILESSFIRSEDGRGELARMTKQSHAFGVEVPLNDQTRLAVLGAYFFEEPHHATETFHSFGSNVELNHRFSDTTTGSARFGFRSYTEDDLDSLLSGGAKLAYRYDDWLDLSGGYERSDEIYNKFGLAEGTQSDSLWISAAGPLTQNFDFAASARELWYTDSNSGQVLIADLERALSEQPKQFKLGIRGEFRNTDEDNRFLNDAAGTVNIIHPYWTPREYGAIALTTQWLHELSEVIFCYQRRHYYQIRLVPYAATDGNFGAELTSEWVIEMGNGLGLGLRLGIQRSELYDAEQGSAFVSFAF